jgi:hypothetical protein
MFSLSELLNSIKPFHYKQIKIDRNRIDIILDMPNHLEVMIDVTIVTNIDYVRDDNIGITDISKITNIKHDNEKYEIKVNKIDGCRNDQIVNRTFSHVDDFAYKVVKHTTIYSMN